MKSVPSLFCALLLVVLVPGGQASPLEQAPPSDLQGQVDAESKQVTLTWLPPDNGSYVYRVYADAMLLANTTLTNHTTGLVPGVHVYWVTATAEGSESPPSQPIAIEQVEGEYKIGRVPEYEIAGIGGGGGGCEPIILHTGDTPPFADVIVREECLPPLPCPDNDYVRTSAVDC